MATSGIAELSPAIDHFHPLPLQNDNLKLYWLDNLQGLERDNVWSLPPTTRTNSQTLHTCNIFPISNAKVERGLTDWRSSLGEGTLATLMWIYKH